MSILTIAIIIAVVLIILYLYYSYSGNIKRDFPEPLDMVMVYGIPIDFIVIEICVGVRWGWGAFLVAVLALTGIFYVTGMHTIASRVREKTKRQEEETRRRFQQFEQIRYDRSASTYGHEKSKEESSTYSSSSSNHSTTSATASASLHSKDEILLYLQSQCPRYKFDGYEARIWYKDYTLHKLGDSEAVCDYGKWDYTLNGKMTIKDGAVEIQYPHPHGGPRRGFLVEYFMNKWNAENNHRGRKLEYDSEKRICMVSQYKVNEIPFPISELESHMDMTASILESIDKAVTELIWNAL